MNEKNTSLPEGVDDSSDLAGYGHDETTLVTVPKTPVFENGEKRKVTKSKKHRKKRVEPFRCELCNAISKKINILTCEICKAVGMAIYNVCKRCARKHDIVGSPYSHKAQWTPAYPDEVFQI